MQTAPWARMHEVTKKREGWIWAVVLRIFVSSRVRAATRPRYPSFDHSELVAAVLLGICLVASVGVWAACIFINCFIPASCCI